MDLKRRITKLEFLVGSDTVSWKLKDGTEIKALGHEIFECFYSALLQTSYASRGEKSNKDNFLFPLTMTWML
jgi:hypothetical protein